MNSLRSCLITPLAVWRVPRAGVNRSWRGRGGHSDGSMGGHGYRRLAFQVLFKVGTSLELEQNLA